MKKNLLVISSALLFFGGVEAQIPNVGFETWTTFGSYSDPNGWGTINQQVSQACFCSGTASKATAAADIHNGSMAIKLKTLNVVLGTAPGIAATGTINTQTQNVDGGIPYTLRPDSITGWYKYAPSGTDTGSVFISLTKWNAANGSRDIVGEAKFIRTTAMASYSRFAKALVYSLSVAPDTMMVILLSSSGGSPQVNSTMYIDDLGLTFSTSTGIYEQSLSSLVSVYPNPVVDQVSIASEFKNFDVNVFDAEGRSILRDKGNDGIYRFDTSNLSGGIYFYSTISDDGRAQSGKFSVIR